MSSIIIDGYNVIGIYHRDLEKQRGLFIDSLIEYKKKKGHDITVVFDGWKTGDIQETQLVISGVRVIYSKLAEKADAVIKRIISSEKREWIVVTSDRDIASHAWALRSVPIASEDFLRAIDKEQIEKAVAYDEEEYNVIRRKGNPKKPSKKEKATKRVLSKL